MFWKKGLNCFVIIATFSYICLQSLQNTLPWRTQVLYGNQREILQLVWVSTLATQAMRVVLGYTRMYTYFEGGRPTLASHSREMSPPCIAARNF
jgi:hypothetical protein